MLGIDVAKDTLACALLDPHSRRKIWFKEVANTQTGIKLLLKQAPPEAVWVIEPTGRYGEEVARLAQENGRDVRLAFPKKAKGFLYSVHDRAKTDRLDAIGLALYALNRELPAYPLKDPMHDELDQLLKARRGVSQSLSEMRLRQRDLPRAAKALEPVIDGLKHQLAEMDKQIKEVIRQPEMALVRELQKVPGIGLIVATTVASRLTAREFPHSNNFVAYCGLDIRVRESGKKKGNLGLAKSGDSELRRLLYVAAQASLKAKDSPFKVQYDRERAKGLSSTAALCAVARKMARLCWSLAKHGTSYDPERVYIQ